MAGELEGGCACGAVRYTLKSPPMFVHCCHCRDTLPAGVPAFEAYYDSAKLWPAESLARRAALFANVAR